MKNPIVQPINSRDLIRYNAIEKELALSKHKNYLFDLSYLSVLDVEGDKSIEFLQGQLSCDVQLLSDIKMIQGAQCNLKGRILSLIDIISWNGTKLVLPKDLTKSTSNSLSKSAQLSRVAIHENSHLDIFGFYLQNESDLLSRSLFLPDILYGQSRSEFFCYYHLGNGFYIFLVKKDAAAQFIEPFVMNNQFLGSLTWHTLTLANKHITIYPESRGLFLPHRLDLHQTSYISFNKGCYKGQEIIARTHYRATLKHELKLYKIVSNEQIYSGQKIFTANDNAEQGELIDYSLLDENSYLVAVSVLKASPQKVRFEGHNEIISLEQY